jgi:putative phosphoesterase
VRLGVISDTHGLLRPEVLGAFAEVDHILHGGDVGTWEVVSDLKGLAPVTAVYGNVDGPEIRSRLPQVAALRLDGFDIVVTHGDQFGSPTPAQLVAAFPKAEIIVFGHTHRPLLELVDRTVTVMNPGGAGAARFGIAPSVGIMELEPGIPPRARVVPLARAGRD